MANCIQKDIGGNWLVNGHLKVCLLKLAPPSQDQWQNDYSRAGNVSIITQLLKPLQGTEKCLLEQEFPETPSLVLAPELAFGSPDFELLDTLVKQYSQNLIFICGFGFTSGDVLTAHAQKSDAEGVWNTTPNPTKKYNGGWVWVKNGSSTHCYIFLKNYFEQSAEITLPNLTEGDCILRLEGSDLVIFPLVCADLICKETDSPCKRIAESLATNNSKKVVITGSLLNLKSESGHWKAAIGDLLESVKASNSRLLLSNCINPDPTQDENIDKWRCLSGAYQHREGSKPPPKPLPIIRYIEDTKFSGFVLRNSSIEAVFGKLKWTNNVSEGLHVFSECSQQVWKDDKFHSCDGDCYADELCRFILRHKGKLLHEKISSSDEIRSLSDGELEKLITDLSPASNSSLRSVAGKLFQKCLKGTKKEEQLCPDKLYNQSRSLDCAITTLRLLQHAVDAELMPKDKELGYGQLLSADEEHEILVWDSSEHTASQLYDMVKEGLVKEGGSARPLIIVGSGNGGGTAPEDGRIRSNRLADISNAPPLKSDTEAPVERDICEANDRVVFWKNQGKIDDILSSSNPSNTLIESLREEISMSEDS